jgi:hypothetical protein
MSILKISRLLVVAAAILAPVGIPLLDQSQASDHADTAPRSSIGSAAI